MIVFIEFDSKRKKIDFFNYLITKKEKLKKETERVERKRISLRIKNEKISKKKKTTTNKSE